MIKLNEESYTYEGEIDEMRRPCGFGVATSKNKLHEFSGTWLNGLSHGICKSNYHFVNTSVVVSGVYTFKNDKEVYECKNGEIHGRLTEYIYKSYVKG